MSGKPPQHLGIWQTSVKIGEDRLKGELILWPLYLNFRAENSNDDAISINIRNITRIIFAAILLGKEITSSEKFSYVLFEFQNPDSLGNKSCILYKNQCFNKNRYS